MVPSFSVMSSCHLLLGRPLDLFPLLGCHSVHRLVHLLSCIAVVLFKYKHGGGGDGSTHAPPPPPRPPTPTPPLLFVTQSLLNAATVWNRERLNTWITTQLCQGASLFAGEPPPAALLVEADLSGADQRTASARRVHSPPVQSRTESVRERERDQ